MTKLDKYTKSKFPCLPDNKCFSSVVLPPLDSNQSSDGISIEYSSCGCPAHPIDNFILNRDLESLISPRASACKLISLLNPFSENSSTRPASRNTNSSRPPTVSSRNGRRLKFPTTPRAPRLHTAELRSRPPHEPERPKTTQLTYKNMFHSGFGKDEIFIPSEAIPKSEHHPRSTGIGVTFPEPLGIINSTRIQHPDIPRIGNINENFDVDGFYQIKLANSNNDEESLNPLSILHDTKPDNFSKAKNQYANFEIPSTCDNVRSTITFCSEKTKVIEHNLKNVQEALDQRLRVFRVMGEELKRECLERGVMAELLLQDISACIRTVIEEIAKSGCLVLVDGLCEQLEKEGEKRLQDAQALEDAMKTLDGMRLSRAQLQVYLSNLESFSQKSKWEIDHRDLKIKQLEELLSSSQQELKEVKSKYERETHDSATDPYFPFAIFAACDPRMIEEERRALRIVQDVELQKESFSSTKLALQLAPQIVPGTHLEDFEVEKLSVPLPTFGGAKFEVDERRNSNSHNPEIQENQLAVKCDDLDPSLAVNQSKLLSTLLHHSNDSSPKKIDPENDLEYLSPSPYLDSSPNNNQRLKSSRILSSSSSRNPHFGAVQNRRSPRSVQSGNLSRPLSPVNGDEASASFPLDVSGGFLLNGGILLAEGALKERDMQVSLLTQLVQDTLDILIEFTGRLQADDAPPHLSSCLEEVLDGMSSAVGRLGRRSEEALGIFKDATIRARNILFANSAGPHQWSINIWKSRLADANQQVQNLQSQLDSLLATQQWMTPQRNQVAPYDNLEDVGEDLFNPLASIGKVIGVEVSPKRNQSISNSIISNSSARRDGIVASIPSQEFTENKNTKKSEGVPRSKKKGYSNLEGLNNSVKIQLDNPESSGVLNPDDEISSRFPEETGTTFSSAVSQTVLDASSNISSSSSTNLSSILDEFDDSKLKKRQNALMYDDFDDNFDIKRPSNGLANEDDCLRRLGVHLNLKHVQNSKALLTLDHIINLINEIYLYRWKQIVKQAERREAALKRTNTLKKDENLTHICDSIRMMFELKYGAFKAKYASNSNENHEYNIMETVTNKNSQFQNETAKPIMKNKINNNMSKGDKKTSFSVPKADEFDNDVSFPVASRCASDEKLSLFVHSVHFWASKVGLKEQFQIMKSQMFPCLPISLRDTNIKNTTNKCPEVDLAGNEELNLFVDFLTDRRSTKELTFYLWLRALHRKIPFDMNETRVQLYPLHKFTSVERIKSLLKLVFGEQSDAARRGFKLLANLSFKYIKIRSRLINFRILSESNSRHLKSLHSTATSANKHIQISPQKFHANHLSDAVTPAATSSQSIFNESQNQNANELKLMSCPFDSSLNHLLTPPPLETLRTVGEHPTLVDLPHEALLPSFELYSDILNASNSLLQYSQSAHPPSTLSFLSPQETTPLHALHAVVSPPTFHSILPLSSALSILLQLYRLEASVEGGIAAEAIIDAMCRSDPLGTGALFSHGNIDFIPSFASLLRNFIPVDECIMLLRKASNNSNTYSSSPSTHLFLPDVLSTLYQPVVESTCTIALLSNNIGPAGVSHAHVSATLSKRAGANYSIAVESIQAVKLDDHSVSRLKYLRRLVNQISNNILKEDQTEEKESLNDAVVVAIRRLRAGDLGMVTMRNLTLRILGFLTKIAINKISEIGWQSENCIVNAIEKHISILQANQPFQLQSQFLDHEEFEKISNIKSEHEIVSSVSSVDSIKIEDDDQEPNRALVTFQN